VSASAFAVVVAACGPRGVEAYPAPDEPRVPLAGEAAGFVGPTDACPLGGPRQIAGALMTNVTETCTELKSKAARSSSGLFVYAAVEGVNLPPAGRYKIELSARGCGERTADVGAELIVAHGANGAPARLKATAGIITFTRIDYSRVTGSFDVTFEGGGHARGPFSAPICDVDWTLFGRPRPREPLQ
jgi:hypothetical protein